MSTQSAIPVELGHRAVALQHFRRVQRHLGNAFYGIADYLAQPLGMLIAAPFLVHHLGLQQYGVWMLVAAVLGSMGMLGTGFGDATMKYVSTYKALSSAHGVRRTIRGTLTINALLGGLLALGLWAGARFTVLHIFKIEPQYHLATISALRIASLIMFIRSIESVFVSTLRAYECYGPTVKISVLTRSCNIVAAVALAAMHFGVVAIMASTLVIALIGLLLQALAVRRSINGVTFWPSLDRSALKEIFSFGCFSWFQGLAAVAFMHADRLLVGAMLGTSEVAYYAICVQATQSVHGFTAAALNFIFPHMSSQYEAGSISSAKRAYRLAKRFNLLLCTGLSLPLILFAKPILTLWMGPAVAQQAFLPFSLLALAYGVLGITVVPHYTLLALGEVRFVSFVNVLAGILSLGAAALLMPSFGLVGAAIGRLLYGPVVSFNFLKARQRFLSTSSFTDAEIK